MQKALNNYLYESPYLAVRKYDTPFSFRMPPFGDLYAGATFYAALMLDHDILLFLIVTSCWTKNDQLFQEFTFGFVYNDV